MKKRICRHVSVILLSCLIVLAAGAYVFYQDLRKGLAGRIAERAGAAIGQRVRIGDISLRGFPDVVLHDLAIGNPEGFEKGELLRIRRLVLGVQPRELLDRRFVFTEIYLHEPEIILQRDRDGRLNISEGLRAFLASEPKFDYRIERLRIESGHFTYPDSEMLEAVRIDLAMHDLSTQPDMRTTFKGIISLQDDTAAEVNGWVYPKREAKDFDVTISSDSPLPSGVREYLGRYGIRIGRTDLSLEMHAAGDIEKGVSMSSKAGVGKAGLPFFRSAPEINMTLKARYDIPDDMLSIEDLSLTAGKGSSFGLNGKISNLKAGPSYAATARIGQFDLSRLNIMEGIEVGGIISSDRIGIEGNAGRLIRHLTGILRLHNGMLRTAEISVGNITAEAAFSSGKEMSLDLSAAGSLSRIQGLFSRPGRFDLSLYARGKPDDARITSSAHLSPVVIPAGEKAVSLEGLQVSAEGRFTGGHFRGRTEIDTADFRFGTYGLDRLKSTFSIDAGKDIVSVRGLHAESDLFRIDLDSLVLAVTGPGKAYAVTVRDTRISYPSEEAEITNLDADLSLAIEKKSHAVSFSLQKAAVRKVAVQEVKGRAKWENGTVSLAVGQAGIAGGRVRLSAETKQGKDLFPLSVAASGEDADLGDIHRMAAGFVNLPYDLGGTVRTIAFEGIIESLQSARGRGSILAEKVSVTSREKKRFLLKNATLQSDVSLSGRDADIRMNVTAGKVAATLSGSIQDLPSPGRQGSLRIVLPETKGTDIREAFWDVFPDALLYAGIEGSLSADVTLDFGREEAGPRGHVSLNGLTIEGENGEFTAGPVSGTIPFNTEASGGSERAFHLPLFEPAAFQDLRNYYAAEAAAPGEYSTIRISAFRYGFELLEDITLQIRQTGRLLNVGRFSATIFGGRLHGSAVLDLSDGLRYRGGLILDDMSLTTLCDTIEPLRGYLSGRVSGTVSFAGSGSGIAGLAGKGDFWTYDAQDEKRKISREFLLKIGGPRAGLYLGDRRYDKGVIRAEIRNGSVVFRELEISNRNFFGIRDLSIMVAPFSNKISIEHLLWTIAEAAERAKDK